jgi:hypothetical protein
MDFWIDAKARSSHFQPSIHPLIHQSAIPARGTSDVEFCLAGNTKSAKNFFSALFAFFAVDWLPQSFPLCVLRGLAAKISAT